MQWKTRKNLISWDNTAPECDVRETLTMGRGAFHREILYRDRRRNRIEWHIHDGCNTARSRSFSSGIETLPVSSSGFIEMNVGTEKFSLSEGNHSKIDVLTPLSQGE